MDTRYLKQIATYVLTTVLSIGLILYIGYHMFKGIAQHIEVTPATVESVVAEEEMSFTLFRDETLLYSDSREGSRVPTVTDGTKVGVGQTVSRRYELSSPDVVASIRDLESQLDTLIDMHAGKLSLRDAASIEAEIYSLIGQIASVRESGNAASLASLRTALSSAMNRYRLLTDVSSDYESAIGAVSEERDSLIRRLGAVSEEFTAPVSGYYYANADGYESLCTGETARTMTPAELLSIRESGAAAVGEDSVGKLATDYRWYAATLLSAEQASTYTLGQSYTVTFSKNPSAPVQMKLERSVADGRRTMLVFSSEELPSDFRFTRHQSASVARLEYTGLRIPASALRVIDGVSGVYIREGSVIHFRAVRVLYEKEDFLIVENAPKDEAPAGTAWLRASDIVVTKGRNLYEGRVLS